MTALSCARLKLGQLDGPLVPFNFIMPTVDTLRPPKLYRYSEMQWLKRALTLGEFRLRPLAPDAQQPLITGEQIMPFGPKKTSVAGLINYLSLSLTTAWDEKLFDEFPGADGCLVIHNAEEFGERIHRAAQRALPNWAGIDAAISYGMPSPLGAAFSKAKRCAIQKEWLFAWRPVQGMLSANPVIIHIGNIEGIAELKARPLTPT
jgi:hypothetical protein